MNELVLWIFMNKHKNMLGNTFEKADLIFFLNMWYDWHYRNLVIQMTTLFKPMWKLKTHNTHTSNIEWGKFKKVSGVFCYPSFLKRNKTLKLQQFPEKLVKIVWSTSNKTTKKTTSKNILL